MTNLTPQALFSLEGSVLLVTGAGGQLGSGIISAALAAGAKVIATDMETEPVSARMTQEGWPAEQVAITACDIRVRADIDAALALGTERFGEVNGLINNAGVSVFEPFLERPEESFDWVSEVNLKGTFLAIQAFIQYRSERDGGGTIVNIASHYGLISPDPRIYTDCLRRNSEVYGATKAGVIQMTRYFAVHGAEHGIRVNAVSPGGVLNPEAPQGEDFQERYGFRCPMGRMADTHEISGAVVFLLSRAASYVNGHNLVVDGGMTAW
ncbi:MAG: SDR family oxidoreductase [Magnetococcales bacterium]|nr:SDR family oxidoreductase [Magnetococcales bacterium]